MSLVDLRARTHTYMQHASTCHARTHACRDAVTPLERFPIPGNLGVDLICSMRSCYMCEEAWRGAAAAWIGWDRGFCAFSCSWLCCIINSWSAIIVAFSTLFFLAFVRSSSHLHTYICTQKCSSRCLSLVVHASSRQLLLSVTNHTADRGKKKGTPPLRAALQTGPLHQTPLANTTDLGI
jgi:hypothetical protein